MAVAFVAAVHLAWLFGGQSEVLQGGLEDGDSFMRLVRVQRLIETGDWFDVSIPRANAPYGTTMHWTRPLDVLLLVLAAPTAPFLGFDLGLYVAGAALSPLLHILTVVAMAWAAAPLIGRVGACLAGGLTAAQIGFMGYAIAGNADHHILFALINVLAFGFIIRSFSGQRGSSQRGSGQRGAALAAGALISLGFWIGIEEIAFLAICLGMIGLPWLLGEKDSADRNYHLCLGLTLSLALVLLAERGPEHYLGVEYDRVSIIQMTIAALLLTFWGCIRAWPRFWENKGTAPRLAAGVLGAAVIAAVTRLLFPNIFLGSLASVDPRLMFLISGVLEYAPIRDVWYFLIYVGGAVFALPWAAWRFKEEWPGPNRWPWALVGAALLVYLAFAASWVRWVLYVGIFLSIPLADLIVRIDFLSTERLTGITRVLVNTLAILFITVAPLGAGATGALLNKKAVKTEALEKKKTCVLKDMTEFLNQSPWSDRPRAIVASVNLGPEILYRTPHNVLATLHHRNSAGILDSITILGGGDDAESLRLVRERSIDLLLLCPGSNADGYFLKDEGGERVLYRRLVKGDLPGWLKEVSVPASLASGFRLFQVASSTEIR